MSESITPATGIEAIDAAVADEKLIKRASLDAAEALARFAAVGRSSGEAVALLDTMRRNFDRAGRHAKTKTLHGG